MEGPNFQHDSNNLPSFSQRHVAKAKLIKALAHPARLFIAEVLAQRELSVCELRELLGLDISTVSKHLALMKEAGIVRDRKQGTKVRYQLAIPCLLMLFSCVEEALRCDLHHKVEVLNHG